MNHILFFYISLRHCTTTTRKCLISRFMEGVNKRRYLQRLKKREVIFKMTLSLSLPSPSSHRPQENGEWEAGKEHGERENEKWEQNRHLEMKLMTGLGFKLGFVPIFHFPVPRVFSPLQDPSLSNMRRHCMLRHKSAWFHFSWNGSQEFNSSRVRPH